MRAIKIRAWNKKTKVWLYWELGKDCMCDLQIYNYLTHYGQFTGLKEKNGKESYEGDIVKDEEGIFQITFDHGAFCFNDGEDNWPIGRWCQEFKIIGNIYENPELLPDKEG